MNETYTIWVCQCCMLMHANGECCADDEHGGDGIEPWVLLGDGEHVFMGDEVDTYSTSQCQGCGSYLHGERHAFTLWSK